MVHLHKKPGMNLKYLRRVITCRVSKFMPKKHQKKMPTFKDCADPGNTIIFLECALKLWAFLKQVLSHKYKKSNNNQKKQN